MASRDELDRLSSAELHDRAVGYATRHLDVRFLWELLKIAPAARMAAGDQGAAEHDVEHWSGQVADAFRDDDGGLSDAMRPMYLDYLERHPDA